MKPAKGLISLLGVDYHLMKKYPGRSVERFRLAAISLIVITVISILSIGYLVRMLFHMLHVELLLSVFISSLFMLMYVFLINTFTKETTSTDGIASLSNISRFGFVFFMAFLISKPVEVFLLKDQADIAVIEYRAHLIDEFRGRVNALYQKDLQVLMAEKAKVLELQRILPTASSNVRLNGITQQIDDIQVAKNRYINAAIDKVESSDFFLYQIKAICGHTGAVLVSMMITLLFITPGYLIYSISREDEYIIAKKEQDHKLILHSYNRFLIRYQETFKKFSLDVSYCSTYEDPPFNTKKKQGHSYKNQTDFMNKFGPTEYPDGFQKGLLSNP